MKDKREPSFIGYESIWDNREDGYGGVGVLVNLQHTFQEIVLDRYIGCVLEVLAVNIILQSGEIISVLNCYNPNDRVYISEIRHYIRQLNKKFIIVGDLNAHTLILDSKCIRSNFTGRMLETLLTEDDICLINSVDMYTYISFSSLKKSCLDVCLTSSNIAPLASIQRMRDVGSDHYPVKVTMDMAPAIQQIKVQKRWILENVNWNNWRNDLSSTNRILPDTVENINKDLISRMMQATQNNIRESSGILNPSKRTSWWSQDISRKIAERRKAKRTLEHHPLIANLQDYKAKCAIARNAVKDAKKTAWQKYINDIKSDTPIKEVWSKIRSIKNKHRIISIPLINDNNMLTNSKEKADCFAKHFEGSNTGVPLQEENEYRKVTEEQMDLPSDSDIDISMQELNYSIRSMKVTAPGIDKISSKFIQELPDDMKEKLLYMFNTSYALAVIPEEWKVGIITPVLKPGKDPTKVSSYRPITLFSCIGKLMERVNNYKLNWKIEQKELLHKSQCGFRKGMGTTDVLIRVNETIKRALTHQQFCIVLYIDLQSAFDSIPHTAIVYKMAKYGIKGRILKWIKEYLTNRRSQVKVFGEYSGMYNNSIGVPQGAVLSPTLFNIVMSDFPKSDFIESYTYADDVTLSISGSNLQHIKMKMQGFIKKLELWFDTWKIKLNEKKTVMQLFTRKRNYSVPLLRWKNKVIGVVSQHKLLGMELDSPKLSWHCYIDTLYADCNKRLDILKTLASTTWGASRKMLRIFMLHTSGQR